ncbi:MAG: KH domain-containing protein [Thermomicrobiales bacterium]
MSDVDDRGTTFEPDESSFDGIDSTDAVAELADGYEDSAANTPVESLHGLISYLVQNLVDDPEAVDYAVEQHGSTVQMTVHVPESDLGKVIGRGGRIAKAMRTALMIAGSRHHLRVSLDIEGKEPTDDAATVF